MKIATDSYSSQGALVVALLDTEGLRRRLQINSSENSYFLYAIVKYLTTSKMAKKPFGCNWQDFYLPRQFEAIKVLISSET